MNRPSDEAIVHGCLILALCVYGFLRGFNFAVVFGIVAVLLIHYRRDFLPERKQTAGTQVGDARFDFEFNQLKEKVNQLSALIAFKTGLAGRTPGAPQGVQPGAR